MVKTNKKCIIDLGKIRIERRIWINENKNEYVRIKNNWRRLESLCVQIIEEDEF